MISNKGFFVPTTMIFIIFFLILLSILVTENITYNSINKMYLEEAYQETAIIKSNEFIQKILDLEYQDTCYEETYHLTYKDYNLEVDPICFFNVNNFYNNVISSLIKPKKLEYSDNDFEDVVSNLKMFENTQLLLTNKITQKIIDFIKSKGEELPEGKLIIKVIEKKLDKELEEYLAFNIKFTDKNKTSKYLYYFDFKEKEKVKIIHT